MKIRSSGEVASEEKQASKALVVKELSFVTQCASVGANCMPNNNVRGINSRQSLTKVTYI